MTDTPDFSALDTRRVDAIVIGASAGGVTALLELLPALTARLTLPVIAVLHLPEGRDSRLTDIFAYRMTLPVREAADKEPVVPGTLYFAGPGYHLSIEADRTFSLSCEPPVHYSRPSIDVLMASAADVYGSRLAGILLTGANQDGAEGLAGISRRGGLTVVQDPADAQVATMPEAALKLFQPDLILTLADIRRLLIKMETHHAH